MNIGYYLFAMVIVAGCPNTLVREHDIRAIRITSNLAAPAENSSVQIKSREKIKDIVTQINCSKREPMVFYADYRLDVKYPHQSLVVLVHGRDLKIDGKTYVADEDIGAMLAKLVKPQ
jgi:hypothetical protein